MTIDVDAIRAKHNELIMLTEAAIVEEAKAMVIDVKRHVATKAKFIHKKGSRRLAAAISRRIKKKANKVLVAIRNSAKHASPLEDGSKGHWIHPRKEGGMLRFKGGAGEWVFRRAVWHPGNDPMPFMRTAIDAAGFKFIARIDGRLRAIAARI